MASKLEKVSSVVLIFTGISLIAGIIVFSQWWWKYYGSKTPASATCTPVFFDSIPDLPGDCDVSIATDISEDGLRVVGASWADENDKFVSNDGGADCSVFPQFPHANQAIGWTRPCQHLQFFPPPILGKAGLIGFGYGSLSVGALQAESYAYGISPDGKVSVGYSNYGSRHSKAVVFLPSPEVKPLAMLDSATNTAFDISMSGAAPNLFSGSPLVTYLLSKRIVVGYSSTSSGEPVKSAGARAVFWNSWDTVNILQVPDMVNGHKIMSSEARCVSDDGIMIGGNLYYDQRYDPWHYMSIACVWKFNSLTQLYEITILDDFAGGDDNALVTDISGDGKNIVGVGNKVAGSPSCDIYPTNACLWQQKPAGAWDKTPKNISLLGGTNYSFAYGVNFDGTVIVGMCFNAMCSFSSFKSTPVIWNLRSSGTYLAKDIKSLLGSKVPTNWNLYWATRVSRNGKIVIGWGFNSPDDGYGHGWVAGLD